MPLAVTREVRDSCLCLHVQRAARVVARRFDVALRPVGLTNQQFSLLVSLNVPRPRPYGGVAALLAMDRTTLTANLKPLVRRGLATISVDPFDRRGRLLAITGEGRAVLAEAVPIWRRTHRKIERLLAGADPESFRADLRALSGTPDYRTAEVTS